MSNLQKMQTSLSAEVFRPGEYPGHLWSTDDCIDVTLIWLEQQRDKLDDAIAKIEAVRPQQTPGA